MDVNADIDFPAKRLAKPTEIEKRMALYRLEMKGMATWPEPQLNHFCGSCAFFDNSRVAAGRRANGYGHCRRVAQLRLGKWGNQIERKFQACSQYGVQQ